jgi:uncharacterized protein YwqG
MTPSELAKHARKLGFSRWEAIERLARVSAAFTPAPSGENPEAHRSFLGGLPRGIEQAAWPRKAGASLSFIAQIELGEVPEALQAQGFPGEGTLLFFYDAKQETWGFDPSDAGSAVVLYVESQESSSTCDFPPDLPRHARYRQVPIKFELVTTLPPWESVLVDDLDLSGEQLSLYQDLCDLLTGDGAWGKRGLFGGHPDQIQGDMSAECALVTAGLSYAALSAYQDPRVSRLRRQGLDWRLLLQVPSAEAAGMTWGDAGCLYFWIHERDLRFANFDASWMILQCG